MTFNILDLAFMVVLAYFMARSLMRGLVRELAGLAGLIAAVMLANLLYRPLGQIMRRLSGQPASWWDGIAFGVLVAAVLLLALYLGHKISGVITGSPLSWLNRLLGGVVGLAKGTLLCFLAIKFLLLLSPLEVPSYIKQSNLARPVERAGQFLVDLVPKKMLRSLKERSPLGRRPADPRGPQGQSPARSGQAP